MTGNLNLSNAVAALVADVVRRKEQFGKVVHAEMVALEEPLFDELVKAGALTAEQRDGAFIEYESILEFGDHVAVVFDVPEAMPTAEYDALSIRRFNGDAEAERLINEYLENRESWLRVEMDGTWIAL